MYSTPHSSLLHVWLACRFLSLLLHFFPSHSHSLLLTHSLTHSVRSPSSLCIHSAPIHPPHTPFSVSIFSLTHTLTHSHTHTYTYTHTLTFAHTYTHSLLLTHYQWTASLPAPRRSSPRHFHPAHWRPQHHSRSNPPHCKLDMTFSSKFMKR